MESWEAALPFLEIGLKVLQVIVIPGCIALIVPIVKLRRDHTALKADSTLEMEKIKLRMKQAEKDLKKLPDHTKHHEISLKVETLNGQLKTLYELGKRMEFVVGRLEQHHLRGAK